MNEDSTIIFFGNEDRKYVLYPHDDALVITLTITNFKTRLVLVDNRSSTDILFWTAFTGMGIDLEKLKLPPIPLKDFLGELSNL